MLKRLILSAVILVAVACPAFGAVAIIQHVSNHAYGNGATVACTLSSTGASRNIIVGAVSASSGDSVLTVSGVADNQGNLYSLASGSRGTYTGNLHGSEIWHSLNATSGVTSITATFTGSTTSYYKGLFCYEVSGTAVTFDTAGKVDAGTCSANLCTGASVSTATSVGFVLGIIIVDPVDLTPAAANEFVSGGNIDSTGTVGATVVGGGASCSLISASASAHLPSWHITSATAPFTSSTSAYKQ